MLQRGYPKERHPAAQCMKRLKTYKESIALTNNSIATGASHASPNPPPFYLLRVLQCFLLLAPSNAIVCTEITIRA